MSKRITIEELQSYLWNSAVLLRTNIDAGAYKQYIFPLLFFKRICDVYDEETAAAIEEYGDDAAEFDEDEIHTTIVKAIPEIVSGIVDAFIGNIDKIIQAGVDLFVALIENLPTIIAEIVKAVPKIVTGIVDAIVGLTNPWWLRW